MEPFNKLRRRIKVPALGCSTVAAVRPDGRDGSCLFLVSLQGICIAAGPGFEPGLSDSESLVLPLHHPAIQRCVL